jgi:transcriptional regulator with XRE-family HTH domain
MKNTFEQFISDPKRHRIYEREALALQASEMIFELMEKEGINKAQLAELMDASRAHITQVLSGSRNMTVYTLADLTFALGHKVKLEALPLYGRRTGCGHYVPQRSEKQPGFFGISHDSSNSPADEHGERQETETNFAVAA